ncbi:MAG: hypothetical protein QOE90_2848 [Thermoplasmata archaeon]|jgi:hypothetical protein|nr:hypothetical protein [Thermoplasmata archaeon]
MLRLGALVVAALLLAAIQATATAGSSSDPDMKGNPNELANTDASTTVGAPEARLYGAWFGEPSSTTISASWQVVDLSHRLQKDKALYFWVGCGSGGARMSVGAQIGGGPQGVADISMNGVTTYHGTYSTNGNAVTAIVPRVAFPAPECVTPAGGLLVMFKSATCPCWSSTSPVWWGQRVPDAGPGRSFYF